MPDQEGKLISNVDFVAYHQQDKLFASWLLSTVSGNLLSCFTGANTTHDIWSKKCHLFAANSKIKSTRDLLNAYGHLVSANKQVDIFLAGFSIEFDSVHTFASPYFCDFFTRTFNDESPCGYIVRV